MKNFLYLFSILLLLSVNIYADGNNNDDCTEEEIIEELDTTTLQVTHTETGSIGGTGGNDEFDYYKFRPAGSGKLTVSYSSPDANTNFSITSVSSCSNNTNMLVTDGQALSDTNLTVNAGKTVHIRIDKVSNQSDYSFTLIWTPDALPLDIIDSPDDCTATGSDQGHRDFCRRTNIITNGGMKTIGNTFLVHPTVATDCSSYTNGPFDPNYGASNADLLLCPYQDLTGIDSTTAELTLPDPANSSIEFAGLYLQSIVNSTSDLDFSNLQIQNRNATGTAAGLKNVAVSKVDYEDEGYDNHISYAAFANVTSIFQTNGWKDGNITVAGAPLHEGSIDTLGAYGAWTLVVIYSNPDENLKSFSVFDGWQIVKGYAGDPDADREIGIQGFYTPKSGAINASVSIFVAEGDRYIPDDELTIVNESTATEHYLGDQDSSIDGVPTRSPYAINNQGIDIHTYDVGSYFVNRQSHVRFHFKNTTTNNRDTHWPSMIAFETDIYEPSFCYDYGYSQNDTYFTNENDGTELPRLEGDPIQDDLPIKMNLYIKNLEESDVNAQNLYLDIRDINGTQADYISDTVTVTYPNSITPVPISDTDLTIGPESVTNINIGTVTGNDYFYTQYQLDPVSTSVDMPINVEMRYDLQFSNGVTIPFRSTLGGEKLPMCTGGSSYYSVEWSRFDVVDSTLYSSANKKYNIPTQVARRPGTFSVISVDPNDLITENPVTSIVSVELIDADAYHVTTASCEQSNSAISGQVWVTFGTTDPDENGSTTIEPVNIDAAMSNQNEYYTPNPDYPASNAEDFYSVAKKNVAFRISYNVPNPDEEELILLSGSNNAWQIDNFVQLVQDIGECARPVRFNINTAQETTQVAAVCGDSGAATLTNWQLTRCQECILGYKTKFVCSRDNFAIRPEAFDFKIYDRPDNGASEIEIPKEENLAVGYSYDFDVIATSHTQNTPTVGYSQYFNGGTDANLTFEWAPNGHTVSGCLTTDNQSPFLYMDDGLDVDGNGSSSTLGRYETYLIDKQWTQVDVNPPHHSYHDPVTNINYANYFVAEDCIQDSDIVPLYTGVYALDKVGCNISSEHTNLYIATNLVGVPSEFTDFNLTFRPYALRAYVTTPDANSLWVTKGSSDQNITGDDYVYMNNIKTELGNDIPIEDIQMSTRYRAFVRPVGADHNGSLQNFVDNCYAEPILMDNNLTIPTSTANFRYRSITGTNTNLSNFTTSESTSDVDNIITTDTPVIISTSAFDTTSSGTVALEVDYNYDREHNTSINPIDVNFAGTTFACEVAGDCTRVADGVNEDPRTPFVYDSNITYLYARQHIPRHRSQSADVTVPIYYEFYCDSTVAPACDISTYSSVPNPGTGAISPNALLSPDSVRWYVQTLHDTTVDGNTTSVNTRFSTDASSFTPDDATNLDIDSTSRNVNISYNGNKGYPYKVTLEVPTQDWLIYNRYNGTDQTINNGGNVVNNFELEFNTAGDWVGLNRSNMEDDTNASATTNRRIQW